MDPNTIVRVVAGTLALLVVCVIIYRRSRNAE
jgi:hypothetical protein